MKTVDLLYGTYQIQNNFSIHNPPPRYKNDTKIIDFFVKLSYFYYPIYLQHMKYYGFYWR
jgi:hypothetical protein